MDDGPHLVYCPEADFDQDEFVSSIEKCLARLGRCLVAVSEGIHDSSGKLFMQVTIHALSPAEKLLPPPPHRLSLSLFARACRSRILMTSAALPSACVHTVARGAQTYAESSGSKIAGMKDSHGNISLGGTGVLGDALAGMVKEKLGKIRIRADTCARSFACSLTLGYLLPQLCMYACTARSICYAAAGQSAWISHAGAARPPMSDGFLQRGFPADTSEVDAREAAMVSRHAPPPVRIRAPPPATPRYPGALPPGFHWLRLRRAWPPG
jgi:hypothetical protein